jgi:hypothetical protein
VEPDAAHAARARGEPEARLRRPLARLARCAPAHRQPGRSVARRVARAPADGRASWQFGKKKDEQGRRAEASLPTFGRLAVGDGHVLYVDEVQLGPASMRASR